MNWENIKKEVQKEFGNYCDFEKTEIYTFIEKIRKIANNLKHSNSCAINLLSQEQIKDLLDIQVWLLEEREGYKRKLKEEEIKISGESGIKESEEKYYDNLVKELDEKKQKIIRNKKLNLVYIWRNNFSI